MSQSFWYIAALKGLSQLCSGTIFEKRAVIKRVAPESHLRKMSDDSREENVYMAKLAEQAERYDEV